MLPVKPEDDRPHEKHRIRMDDNIKHKLNKHGS